MKKISNEPQVHSYLPLQKFHILPIYDISPDGLKKSAKKVSRDREKISHCTLLNACCKSLGFSGGFSGFQKEYFSKLKPFMEKNHLLHLVDLTKQRHPGDGFEKFLILKKQDISERIFFSNKKMPEKIFTGFNFRYDLHFDDGFYLDKISSYYFNLIGDQLITPRIDKYEIQIYYQNDYESEIEKDLKLHEKYLDLFVSRIDSLNEGWVNIIPYNENLVFLQGENGEYDFIYKNQRDEKFYHSKESYGEFLKLADIPNFDDFYHFKRWLYFEYQGFRQEMHHLAEIDFYKNGGNGISYSGSQEVYKRFLIKKKIYTYHNKKTSKKLDGFHEINIGISRNIMVSDLITIKDWKEFCKENRDYIKERKEKNKMDNLESINNEDDNTPVSLTFYDVLKYISWFNEKNDANVRLLNYEEYKKISPHKQKERCEWADDIEFLYEGKVTKEAPPYMREEKFQNIIMRFSKELNSIKWNSINFINSDRFAEWILEKSCIRSKTLTSFYGDEAVIRAAPPLESSGKYKYTKIGFRLCYDL
ncbi:MULTISPECIES: hypothetical protein [Pasteurellaceae]|uniref:hypothetical protein n=1 Tax=Pasteurellaceae TaxID=712 RepID=UPI000530F14A|nr:hypothetical protein [Gallibacterium anatis]KGQ56605.1 hypothetical protein IO44_02390 [Gallibacterium anatis str. Avicor]